MSYRSRNGENVVLRPVGVRASVLISTLQIFKLSKMGLTLSIQPQGNEVNLRWTATSVTPVPPYEHYDFQLQQSSTLSVWSNTAPRISGSTLTAANRVLSHRVSLGNSPMFFRLVRWLDRPGADLSGFDLRGADLQGANLAGADLTGAQFHGFNIEGVDLSALLSAGVDLSGTIGTSIFRQVRGAPTALVSELLPRLPKTPTPEVFTTNNTGKAVAKQLAAVDLNAGATVSQLNALPAARGQSGPTHLPFG